MDASSARRLKALEAESTRLKKLLAESMLENEVTREALRENGDCAGALGAGAVDADASGSPCRYVSPKLRCRARATAER